MVLHTSLTGIQTFRDHQKVYSNENIHELKNVASLNKKVAVGKRQTTKKCAPEA